MRRLFVVLLAISLAPLALAQTQSFSSLEERMSAKDFRAAGLDKLSEAELTALNAWIERNVRLADPSAAAAMSQGSAPASSAQAEPSQVGFDNPDRDAFTSSIKGTFKGWFGKTQFRLENGQVWQQVGEDRYQITLESPTVTISPGAFGSWRLKVGDYNQTTSVKRIR